MENQDENIKKFNLRNYYNENKKIFVSFLILVIVSTILIIGVREYYSKVNKDISNKFNKAKILIQKNNSIEAAKILGNIIEKNNSFYSPSALNLIIENNLIKDKEQILSYFDEVISETDLDTDIRDLFIFKKIIFLGDEIDENEMLTNLKPIIQSNSPWKRTVSDYIRKYYRSKNEFNKAKEFENQ